MTEKDIENKLKERYTEAIGRRKRAVARVRIFEEKQPDKCFFVINNRDINSYFVIERLQYIANEALVKVKVNNRFSISVKVHGSGVSAQAQALRHGLAKALVAFDEEWKKKLRKIGLLKHDVRIVERKKFGLKKARKSPQWSKR